MTRMQLKMPRTARQKSITGVYHIILRGTNRGEVFHDDEDKDKFLKIIYKYKKIIKFKVYGWCLMDNHVHLLMEEGQEPLSKIMKRIGVSFVSYYHAKYNTTGHLFQDRYKSENVETTEYLMTVIRYIHQNPVKSGLIIHACDWKWSSCEGYYTNRIYPYSLLDRSLILGLFSSDYETSIKGFKEFNEAQNQDKCLDDTVRKKLTDEEARMEINKLLSGVNIAQIKSFKADKRDEFIKRIKGIGGVSQRQIARITGLSQSLISRK